MLKGFGPLFLFLAPAVFAQTPESAAPALHYEVVSIHQSRANPDADTTDYRGHLHDSRVDIQGFSNLNLLVSAFGLGFFQIELPKGLPFAIFDLHLSSGEETDAALRGLSDDQAKEAHALMLQEVLVDRFHLRYHFVERDMKGHVLTIGTPGKLRASAVRAPGDQAGSNESGLAKSSLRWDCSSIHCAFQARGYSLDWLADRLSVTLRAPVVNQTGLIGLWDLELRWEVQPSATVSTDDDSYPPLNAALAQQLGLRLSIIKAPTRVLIVDHIEPPSPN